MFKAFALKELKLSIKCKFPVFNYRVRNMKLLTHNMLTSKCMKGVSVGYPLGIVIPQSARFWDIERDTRWEEHAISLTLGGGISTSARDIKVHELEFNLEFIQRLIPKLDWDVLYKAADSIGYADDLPEKLGEDYENDNDLLRKVHHILLEVEVINGDLVCPETGRKFPISNGIPNMLLNEDEL